MTPEQRIESLEKTIASLMGVMAAHSAAIVSLINTHPDRVALGALLEISTEVGLETGRKQRLPSENLDAFLQVSEGLQATATGVNAMNVGQAREVLQSILKKPGGRAT